MRWVFFMCVLIGCDGRITAKTLSSIGGEGDSTSNVNGSGGGDGTGGSNETVDPCATASLTIGTSPLRRLSHEEYKNSISDLQPTWASVVTNQTASFTQDSESLGFKNGATFLDVKPVLASQYMTAAEAIAAQAVTQLTALLPCTPTNNEAPCAEQFIRVFGRKLYRRALTDEEVTRYKTVYGSARTQGYDFKTGIEWVVFGFLNSPGFLYRAELDTPGSTGVRTLTGVELASRLSYLIWQSGPDETLLTAAEKGQLTTREEIAAQAKRMIDDVKARRLVTFFDQWLKWEGLETLTRDSAIYGTLPSGLGSLMHTEAKMFAEKTVFDGDSKLSSLLTGSYSYVNQTLAQHYGISGVTGSSFQRVNLTGRGGLMMLGGNLAVRDLPTRTSIVHRGVALRTLLMCQIVPSPPPDIPALGPIDSTLSQTQRLAIHRQDPACATCHSVIDALGTPFEAFDAVGRTRTKDEAGHSIDSTGELTRSRDEALNGPVANALELMNKFSLSNEVRDCFATQMYRFSMGRKEETADRCSQSTIKKQFQQSGGDVKQLLMSLTQLDDFDHRLVQP